MRSNSFAETWSDAFIQSLGINELLHWYLKDASTNTTFPTSSLSQQFAIVANLISTREARDVDTDTFYVEIGGDLIQYLVYYYWLLIYLVRKTKRVFIFTRFW